MADGKKSLPSRKLSFVGFTRVSLINHILSCILNLFLNFPLRKAHPFGKYYLNGFNLEGFMG
jgi:hypothetical protein